MKNNSLNKIVEELKEKLSLTNAKIKIRMSNKESTEDLLEYKYYLMDAILSLQDIDTELTSIGYLECIIKMKGKRNNYDLQTK